MKRYRPWTPDQMHLLPPSPREWLRDDHEVYFLLDLVSTLDISAIEVKIQRKDPRGNRPYDPRMMLALLIYGYCVGVRSSRKIERATYESVPFRVLSGGDHPDHTRISEFRRIHKRAFEDLFRQVLLLCETAGLVNLGHVSLDGTKMPANASKHKAMSYSRMEEKERELEEQIRQIVEEAEAVDREEDALYGPDARGDELPEELRRRETRLKKIEEAKKQLEAEAAATRARQLKDQARRARRTADEDPDNGRARSRANRTAGKAGAATRKANRKAREADRSPPDLDKTEDLPFHQVKANRHGDPKPKAQRNFTDPESRIMKKGRLYLQAYNCQVAVDEAHQVIVAEAVTNHAADAPHFVPMLDRVEENLGRVPAKLSADAGYCSEENIEEAERRHIDPYIATGRKKDHWRQTAPPEPDPSKPEAWNRMRAKLATEEGRDTYARRKCTAEPVFGHIKAARGFRQFLLRGIEKVRAEWSLACLCHNVLKLFKTWREGGLALSPA